MKEAKNPKLAVPSEIYSSDGKLMGSFMIENRNPVKFDEISQTTIDALIATEDVRFYEHNGVDFRSLGGALLSSFSDDNRGGASTINQQVVKNIFKTRGNKSKGLLGRIPLVRTLIAKVKEWVTALKMNYFFEKDEILTLYLNAVDFGDNTFGIKLASEHFFSKDPKDLEIHESALLIGGLKATNSYNPIRKPENALKRRNVVLGQMLKYQKIDQKAYDAAVKKSLSINPKSVTQDKFIAPYFIRSLKPKLEKWCQENDLNLYADGLKIYATLDSRAQSYAEKAVEEHLASIQKSLDQEQGSYKYWFDKAIAQEKAEYKKLNPKAKEIPETASEKLLRSEIEKSEIYLSLIAQNKTKEEALEIMSVKKKTKLFYHNGNKEVNISSLDSIKYMAQQLQAGLMSIDPLTAEVKAYVGGPSFEYFKYDHVSQASRQPGSSFKPIIYATALEKGFNPCTTIVDQPFTIKTVIKGKAQDWEPKNSTGTYTYAPMSLRKAMAASVNSVAIRVLQGIKPKSVIEMSARLGITSKIEDNLSIALGTSNVKLLELTNAYAAFANSGKLSEPIMYKRIESADGEILFESELKQKQVLNPEVAYNMTLMLRGSVEEAGGTSRRLYSYGIADGNQIGGKTGTTNDYVDGWYMGITQNLVTGVWVGCENSKIHFTSANGQGGRAALPIFGMFMKDVYANKELNITKGDFIKPASYVDLKCVNIVLPQPDSTLLGLDSTLVDSLARVMKLDSFPSELLEKRDNPTIPVKTDRPENAVIPNKKD